LSLKPAYTLIDQLKGTINDKDLGRRFGRFNSERDKLSWVS
jgi:hypothetical protein